MGVKFGSGGFRERNKKIENNGENKEREKEKELRLMTNHEITNELRRLETAVNFLESLKNPIKKDRDELQSNRIRKMELIEERNKRRKAEKDKT